MSYQSKYVDDMNCKENECAWWNKKNKQCAILSIVLPNEKIEQLERDTKMASIGFPVF
jgi:hypothetical protein